VPNVVGQPVKAATKALQEAGFKVDRQDEPSDDVPKGRVVSTTPPAATPIDVGSTVSLTVSSGREKGKVPDVVGQDREDARAQLEQAGFVVDATEQEDADHEPGTVLSQDPAAGTELTQGKTVTITVAKEPENAQVPNVLGRGVDDAVNLLSDAGFVPNQVTETVDRRSQDGRVISQTPVGGTQTKSGSRVTITVGRYVPPTTTPTTPTTTPTTPTPPPTTPTPTTPTPTTPTTTPTTPTP
jgi:serine/threonine-protein kinase